MMVPLSLILFAKLTHAWGIIADGQCQVVISTNSPNLLISKWAYVWEAIGATVAKCVRAGRKGKRKISIYRASSIRRSGSMALICVYQLYSLLETICLLR